MDQDPQQKQQQQEGVKLRSVCDACTSAKVRCNGKMPCERCLKKSIECHYLPFKHRGGGGGDKPGANSIRGGGGAGQQQLQAGQHPVQSISALSESYFHRDDSILDEYERKTWSVFFTLYRSFGKGCSLFWFQQQLFKMLRFLELRSRASASDTRASGALVRLKSWMTALGIDIHSPPEPYPKPPHLKYENLRTPRFQGSLLDLKSYAAERTIPMLNVDLDGKVTVNDAFSAEFAPTVEEMQAVLEDSAGGFLPWCGDLMARLVSREADLILYLQGVANNLDMIGKPQAYPNEQMIPSMNILRLTRKSGQEVICIVRAVQCLHVDVHSFGYASTIIFEIPPTSEEQTVPSKARHFSEIQSGNDGGSGGGAGGIGEDSSHSNKKHVTEKEFSMDELPALPHDTLGMDDDAAWLDSLLNWAAEDSGNQVLSLPIADDMFNLTLEKQ
jgi:hypothetical protein